MNQRDKTIANLNIANLTDNVRTMRNQLDRMHRMAAGLGSDTLINELHNIGTALSNMSMTLIVAPYMESSKTAGQHQGAITVAEHIDWDHINDPMNFRNDGDLYT